MTGALVRLPCRCCCHWLKAPGCSRAQEQGSLCRFMNKWSLLSGLYSRKIIGARWRGEARQTENLPQLPV